MPRRPPPAPPPTPSPARSPAHEKPPIAPGTDPRVQGGSGTDLPLPHERDESPDPAPQAPDEVIRQAAKDLEAGMVDTDMRATPGLDAQRRERMVPGAGGRVRRPRR